MGNTLVCYKNAEFDPEDGSRNDLVTVQWDAPVLKRSSVRMTGVSGDNGWPNFPPSLPDPYQYYVVEDEEHWAFAGTGLSNSDAFDAEIGSLPRWGRTLHALLWALRPDPWPLRLTRLEP